MLAVPVSRRTVLGAGLTAALAGCAPQRSAPTWGEPAADRVAVAPSKSAAARSQPVQRVHDTLTKYLKPTADNPKHPGYAGAVALVMVDGKTTLHTAVGHALRYKAGPVELTAAKRVAMRKDSIFDLASLTKVCTALLVLQLADHGEIDLDSPLQRYLPDFTGTGKDKITIAQLLAHTSGLPVGAKVTGLPDNTARWKAVLTTPMIRGAVPGDTFRYSSVGLMVLGRLVEKLTGKSLDRAVRDHLTTPLGLKDTGFRPLTWLADKQRLVATDARSSRGLLRGTVHDDVANHLGGVAGHAGLFGTARDVAVIGQLMLNGGTYGGKRLLSTEVLQRALTNVNKGKKAIDAERPTRTADHGLGFELNQPWFMGRLASPTCFGHTGFTGTSLLVVPARRMVVVLLTNRAHPNWSWSNPDTHRVAVHNAIA
ncbi:serine hydrolase domain-containing protein [Nucisporomicrobium flavum]|uniref:serine hydrolase domain-containing protein n=1 Tax=Nucisporomicrobium flavum TaxID=2785915 RepID=UPI0018F53039|nr:serine hydrolase domain-containing protein [Nucisporomicrobium flavum]